MLVILQNEQLLSTEKVCNGCLMANHGGTPRWQKGKLGCGQCLGKLGQNQPIVYQCEMGFHLVNIE